MPIFRKCDCPKEGRDSCVCRWHGFIRRHKLIRRTAALGGVLVGLYFLGASQGWWDRFLF